MSRRERIRLVLGAATFLSVAAALAGQDNLTLRTQLRDEKMDYLNNGLVKIGVVLDRGGSIGYFADVKKGDNVVNVHDFGRWIGQSYYAGPRPFGAPHPSWKDWPWNPVSAGDVYGHASTVREKRNDGKTLYVQTAPRQWALDGVAADCTFETWITLDDRAARVRNRLTNHRHDRKQYPAMDQEVPAVYTIGKLHRLFTYDVAELFWQTAEQRGFAAERSIQFPIEPDGEFHTYEIDLSHRPAYWGAITKLRLDPVATGESGEWVRLAFLSWKAK
jgi:hypothetical protein